MTLDCDLTVPRGRITVQLRLTAGPGEVVALVGPNGAGKSTVLRALAGLLPATGRLRLDGADLLATPSEHRRVGWVPQDAALFPHLTARANVAFALGRGRRSRRSAAEAVQWLEAVGVAELADRRPGQLSGGQAQKVALARALAAEPRLLLLDEPLAAIDAAARADLRRVLRRHLAGYDGVALVVTHDPVDVMALADRVVAMEDGRVVQDDVPAAVATAPRTRWLADLMGANAWPGTLTGLRVDLADGGGLTVAEPAEQDGVGVLAVVPASAVTLHRTRPTGSARNVWPVTVHEVVAAGGRARVVCAGVPPVTAEVTMSAVGELGLAEGASLWATVKATEVTVVLL